MSVSPYSSWDDELPDPALTIGGETGGHLFWDPEKKIWLPQEVGTLDVPDIFGAVKCIRFWYLTRQGLRSVAYDHVWSPGEQIAECKRAHGLCRPAEVPGLHCSCGIWLLNPDNEIVYNRMTDYVRDYNDRRIVAGYVYGYGNAIQGTDGWRVSHARIDSLIAPPRYPNYYARPWEVAAMAKAYDVPVVADQILDAKHVWEVPDEKEPVPSKLGLWLNRPAVKDAAIVKKWLGL